MLVQTRSEEFGLQDFATLKEAFDRADEEISIWKISFSLSSGERVRLIRCLSDDGEMIWAYESMDNAIRKDC